MCVCVCGVFVCFLSRRFLLLLLFVCCFSGEGVELNKDQRQCAIKKGCKFTKFGNVCVRAPHSQLCHNNKISRGTSHASAVSTPLVTHVELHASAVCLLKRAENSAINLFFFNQIWDPEDSEWLTAQTAPIWKRVSGLSILSCAFQYFIHQIWDLGDRHEKLTTKAAPSLE